MNSRVYSEPELLSMMDPADHQVVGNFTRVFDGRLVELRKPDGTRLRAESTPVRFLRTLFQPGDGYIELRAIDREKQVSRRFIPADRPERVHDFINEHRDENIYFGAASRQSTRNGRIENCGIVRVLWADIDYKATPEPEARRTLEAFDFQPNIIVATGGGLHIYFLIEPFHVQQEPNRLKSILRRLAVALKGDITATDPARVLRLPATRNMKYDPGREVVLERLQA